MRCFYFHTVLVEVKLSPPFSSSCYAIILVWGGGNKLKFGTIWKRPVLTFTENSDLIATSILAQRYTVSPRHMTTMLFMLLSETWVK